MNLNLEPLESRLCPSPTALEQSFVDQLNAIRENPAAYGASIGMDFSIYPSVGPLAWNTALQASADAKAADLNQYGIPLPLSHTDTNGGNLVTRAAKYGYTDYQSLSESIDAGFVPTVAASLRETMIDANQPANDLAGHRLALLGVTNSDKQIGVAIVHNTGPGRPGRGLFQDYYVVEIGEPIDPTPFLVVPGGGAATVYGPGGFYAEGSNIPLIPGKYDALVNGVPHVLEMGTQNQTYAPGPVDPATDPVVTLYANLLHRGNDFNGVLYWHARLTAGQSMTDVAAGFLTSAEYRGEHPDYVASLYQTLLHREGRPDELAYWLASGLSDHDIALGFLTSRERTGVTQHA